MVRNTFSLITFLLFNFYCVAQQKELKLDMNQVQGPKSSMYHFCVGAGRANEGLRADWQQQLAEIQQKTPFKYIRFHGILNDDMGVYQEDFEGKPIYNWQYIDKLYDFLLSVHIKPFVELSFMPSALASGKKTVFWWKGNVTAPKDFIKWEGLISAFVTHLQERYGREEVKTWYFEVWNEPNHPSFLSPNTEENYYQIYSSTTKAIKSVDKGYKVGGPATAGARWVGELIRYCNKNIITLDFITTHDYGVYGDGLDEFGKKILKLIPNPNTVPQSVKNLKDTILHSAFPKLNLHITEWSSSYSNSDPVHDTYFNAPYVLNVLKKTENSATSMSYWTFTDIFEEHGPPVTPFHGGFGLLNLQGIKKPTFYAYQFLSELGPYELYNTDSSSIICKNNGGDVQALIWNLTMPDLSHTSNKDYFTKDKPAKDLGIVNLEIRNINPGRYKMQVYQTGYRINDPFTAYYDMGLPSQISIAQVKKLKELSIGLPVEESEINITGKFLKSIKMRENDVFFIKLIKI